MHLSVVFACGNGMIYQNDNKKKKNNNNNYHHHIVAATATVSILAITIILASTGMVTTPAAASLVLCAYVYLLIDYNLKNCGVCSAMKLLPAQMIFV
jgi:hypothetical protein